MQSGYNDSFKCTQGRGECEVTLVTRKNCQYCRYFDLTKKSKGSSLHHLHISKVPELSGSRDAAKLDLV